MLFDLLYSIDYSLITADKVECKAYFNFCSISKTGLISTGSFSSFFLSVSIVSELTAYFVISPFAPALLPSG
jgi:hypothetical protein